MISQNTFECFSEFKFAVNSRFILLYKPGQSINECAPSEVSDQPVHPCSLIKVVA